MKQLIVEKKIENLRRFGRIAPSNEGGVSHDVIDSIQSVESAAPYCNGTSDAAM